MSEPKPPVGLTPRGVHDQHRIAEIDAAMERYTEAGMEIPAAWTIEREILTGPGLMGLRSEVDYWKRIAEHHGPCICNTGPSTDGPEEWCPQHGRSLGDFEDATARHFVHWVATNRAHNGSEHNSRASGYDAQTLYNDCVNAALGEWVEQYVEEQSKVRPY